MFKAKFETVVSCSEIEEMKKQRKQEIPFNQIRSDFELSDFRKKIDKEEIRESTLGVKNLIIKTNGANVKILNYSKDDEIIAILRSSSECKSKLYTVIMDEQLIIFVDIDKDSINSSEKVIKGVYLEVKIPDETFKNIHIE